MVSTVSSQVSPAPPPLAGSIRNETSTVRMNTVSAYFMSGGVRVGEVDGDSDGLSDGVAEGLSDGDSVGFVDGDSVGFSEGDRLGLVDGERLGDADGDKLGLVLGDEDGLVDGLTLGLNDGDKLGLVDGERLGEDEGDEDGLLLGDKVGLCDGLDVLGLGDGDRVGVIVGEVLGCVVGLSDGDEVGLVLGGAVTSALKPSFVVYPSTSSGPYRSYNPSGWSQLVSKYTPTVPSDSGSRSDNRSTSRSGRWAEFALALAVMVKLSPTLIESSNLSEHRKPPVGVASITTFAAALISPEAAESGNGCLLAPSGSFATIPVPSPVYLSVRDVTLTPSFVQRVMPESL